MWYGCCFVTMREMMSETSTEYMDRVPSTVITPKTTLYISSRIYWKHLRLHPSQDMRVCVGVALAMDIKWINMKSSKNVTIFMVFCLFRHISVSGGRSPRLADVPALPHLGNNKWAMRRKCCSNDVVILRWRQMAPRTMSTNTKTRSLQCVSLSFFFVHF